MNTVSAVDGPVQSRLLRLLRDTGALSRAELADRLEVPRPRLLADLDALVATGLIREAGPAASPGGRRSTLLGLHPDPRFAPGPLRASPVPAAVPDGPVG